MHDPVYFDKAEQIHAVDGIANGDSKQPRSALGRFSKLRPHLRVGGLRKTCQTLKGLQSDPGPAIYGRIRNTLPRPSGVSPYPSITRSRFGDWRGRLAQLEERLVYTEKVGGSIPSSPTIKSNT